MHTYTHTQIGIKQNDKIKAIFNSINTFLYSFAKAVPTRRWLCISIKVKSFDYNKHFSDIFDDLLLLESHVNFIQITLSNQLKHA